eukprot:2494861-Amphidinium_carterae.1
MGGLSSVALALCAHWLHVAWLSIGPMPANIQACLSANIASLVTSFIVLCDHEPQLTNQHTPICREPHGCKGANTCAYRGTPTFVSTSYRLTLDLEAVTQ